VTLGLENEERQGRPSKKGGYLPDIKSNPSQRLREERRLPDATEPRLSRSAKLSRPACTSKGSPKISAVKRSCCLPLAHLEVETIRPRRDPLPFSKPATVRTSARRGDIEAEGGPVAFVTAWLTWASQSPEWQAQEAAQRQYVLYS